MPQLIIGLVGHVGSGKGTVAKILKEKYGADLFRFSQSLQDILQRLFLDKTRDNLIKLSEALRHTFGEDVLARTIEYEVQASRAALVVVDGIRRTGDIAGFEALPQFHLIEVAAPEALRYQRIKQREEKIGETHISWEEFLRNEQRSTEVTIASIAAKASRTLHNTGTSEELEMKIDQLMKELL